MKARYGLQQEIDNISQRHCMGTACLGRMKIYDLERSRSLKITRIMWYSMIITSLFIFSLGIQFSWLQKPSMTILCYGILAGYLAVCGVIFSSWQQKRKYCIDRNLSVLEQSIDFQMKSIA
jgi:hypothetical protein